MWQTVPRPGETPQAAFLREHVFPRLFWLVLGMAGWGVTALIGCGVWALHDNAQRYQNHPTPAPEPTVYERVIRFEHPKEVDYHIYIGTVDGRLVTENQLVLDANVEKMKRENERIQFGLLHGYGRHPCDLPDGCYDPDRPSELAIEAIALILACVNLAVLAGTLWLLVGAVSGRALKS